MTDDMSETIKPKSDITNADDLIAGPRTIRITRVDVRKNEEQPVTIHYDGDGGKPWKPCKTMRRVLVEAWGLDSSKYIGRSVTLFRDPDAEFGGAKVGGIRISHLSHIQREFLTAVTTKRGKRAPFKVQMLCQSEPKRTSAPPPKSPESLNDLLIGYEMAETESEVFMLEDRRKVLWSQLSSADKQVVKRASEDAMNRVKQSAERQPGDD